MGAVIGLATVPAQADGGGATLFADNCMACHGAGGIGIPGVAPPLNLAPFWQALGPKAPEYVAGVLTAGLTGRITAGGQLYVGVAMPEQGHLSDAELAAIAEWLLTSHGLPEARVPAALIAQYRQAPIAHADLRQMRKAP